MIATKAAIVCEAGDPPAGFEWALIDLVDASPLTMHLTSSWLKK
jgi:hypothetical protein